jgi:phosphoribosylamine--glycine ligase
VCVVAASGGYPGKYKNGPADHRHRAGRRAAGRKGFQAGTRADGKQVVTDGGRVLSVCALGKDIADAQRRAYDA